MNNLLSYCGLVDARISASEKDLPVCSQKKVRAVRLHYIYTSSPRYTSRAADLDRASFYEQSATIVNGLSRASTCCSTRPAASKPRRGGGGGAKLVQMSKICQKLDPKIREIDRS